MDNMKIDYSEDPIRLFDSDFLEFFTHISPVAVLLIWVPVLTFFMYRSFIIGNNPIILIAVAFALGLFLWTFAEYILHRFLFHFPPKTPWQERLSFLFHGIHHKQPKVKSRLVMPPAVSVPLALVFYGIFHLVFSVVLTNPGWVSPVFAGFILGYILYDMTHYSTHHIPMKKGYFRMVRQQHMHHHFKTPNQRFGVTTPFWDYVFGTMPEKQS